MRHDIGLFGVPFDPLPLTQAVLVKQMYIQAKALGNIAPPDYQDPYAFFSDNLPHAVSGQLRLLGQVSIPTWLRPKPEVHDAHNITLDSLIRFMKSGGCLHIANEVREFVINNVFPMTPGMIGVDHSSTYGAISAFREHGEQDLALVVIDSHFDAVPMALRYGLIEYAKETNCPVIPPDLFSESLYPTFSWNEIGEWSELNPENFLLKILEQGLIKPENLIVVGLTDYPSEALFASDNPRVRDYVDFFTSLQRQGACFIPKSTLVTHGKRALAEALQKLHGRQIYVSLDVDTGSLSSVYACRFFNTMGLSFDQIRGVFQALFGCFSDGITLAGFDVMEVDVHKLGAEIDSLHVDQTSKVVSLFLELVGEAIKAR